MLLLLQFYNLTELIITLKAKFQTGLDRFVAADEKNQNFETDVTAECDARDNELLANRVHLTKVALLM